MKSYLAVIGILGLFTLSACLKVEEFPDEPSITLRDFRTYPDSARIVIGFTDGDGDIGLNEADTTGNFAPESVYYNNLFCDYFELQNGEWVKYDDIAIPFYYRVPRVTPSGQNPTLIGEMSVLLAPLYYIPGTGYDTCRFEVKLVDRSLNMSNVVRTRAFVKPN